MNFNELPELTGSPKQVAWGVNCRSDLFDDCSLDVLMNETEAKWWIANRGGEFLKGYVSNNGQLSEGPKPKTQLDRIETSLKLIIKHLAI